MAQFAKEVVAPGGIVLLGSSHFEWFDTDRLLAGWPIVNRGIASDRIGVGRRGILHRLSESVFDPDPCCVVLQSGANDLGELWRTGEPKTETIVKCYRRVVESIRDRLPEAVLCLISVFPTRGEYQGISPQVATLNDEIRRIADSRDADFLDLYSLLVDGSGLLRAELTDDGLHLNQAGYARFAEEMDTYLTARLRTDHVHRRCV